MADSTSLSRHRVRSPAQVAGKLASYPNAAGRQVTCTRPTAGPFGSYIPNGPGACPSATGIVEADDDH